jgi:hypothetical protein
VVDEHAGTAGVCERVEQQLRDPADGQDAGVADERAGAEGERGARRRDPVPNVSRPADGIAAEALTLM